MRNPFFQLKNILSKTINMVSGIFIRYDDSRENFEGLTIVDQQFNYTPDFTYIKTSDIDYYWLHFKNLSLAPLFYKKNSEAFIIGNGIVLNKNGQVLLESTIFQKEYLFKLRQNHFIWRRHFQKEIIQSGIMLSLSNFLEDNYYHWVLESLTRVLLLENAFNVQDLTIVTNDSDVTFKRDSLRFLFDIPVNNIKAKKTNEVFKGDILVPSFTHTRNEFTQMTDVCHPFIIQRLNKKVQEKTRLASNKKFPTKFILSRRNAVGRKILNEEYLLESICDKNFTIVDTQDLSFADQVELFLNASCVISTHGAGLSNIIFSKRIMIIEFFPKERNPRDAFCFAQVSSALGFAHYLITYSSSNESQDLTIDSSLIHQINSILAVEIRV